MAVAENAGLPGSAGVGARRLDRRFAVVPLLVLWVVLLFPGVHFVASTPDVDSGWRYAVNAAAADGFLFGRDLVFTYGPLSYLRVPLDMGPNLDRANVLRLAVHAAFAALLVWHLLRGRSPAGVAVFLAGSFAAVVLGGTYDLMLVLLAPALVFAPYEGGLVRRLVSVLAGALAGFLFLVKFYLGVMALAVAGTYALADLVCRRDGDWRDTLLVAGGFAASVLGLGLWQTGSAGNLAAWLVDSVAIAGGYSTAMSLEGPRVFLFLAVPPLLAFAGAVVFWTRTRGAPPAALLALAPVAVLAFRWGFVRQDHHVLEFFTFMVALAGAMALAAARLRDVMLAAAALAVALACAWHPCGYYGGYTRERAAAYVTGATAWTNVWGLMHREEVRNANRRQTVANLAPRRLPARVVAAMKLPVAVMPWDLTYLEANDVSWTPWLTIQMYSTYTASMDRRTAKFLASDRAPGTILVHCESIDGRHMMTDAPATWREIALRYEVQVGQDVPGLVILRRREERLAERVVPAGRERCVVGSPVKVRDSDGMLAAEVALRMNATGNLRRWFFRVPPVHMELVRADGRRDVVRIVPDVMENGVEISHLPMDGADLVKWMGGGSANRVVAFTICGPGAACLRNEFEVRWSVRERTGRSTEGRTE